MSREPAFTMLDDKPPDLKNNIEIEFFQSARSLIKIARARNHLSVRCGGVKEGGVPG